MAARRTCFIIGPIGDKDSDIRKHADNLIRRVIAPSLSNFSFDIIRVDQSYANSRITDEIVTLIKNSELCIIDSMGNNPNVMYELGRRHEINRPVIMLRPANQSIVFDLKDIKHVDYDLDSVDAVIDTQNGIRGFLEEFDRQGFISSDASVNLDVISTSINRVERRIEDLARALLSSLTTRAPQLSTVGAGQTSQIIGSLGLERGLMFCIERKLVREADEIFERVEPQLSPDIIQGYLALITGMGSHKAFERIDREIIPIIGELDKSNIKIIVSNYIEGAGRWNEEESALKRLEPQINDLLERSDVAKEDKAFYVNQLGRLYSGLKDFVKARELYEQARDWNPSESAFVYNAAGTAHSLGDANAAERLIDNIIDDYLKRDLINNTEKIDYDHLSLAYQIYSANNRHEKAANVIQMIRVGNPLLADYLVSQN